jgi:hypothetical protein
MSSLLSQATKALRSTQSFFYFIFFDSGYPFVLLVKCRYHRRQHSAMPCPSPTLNLSYGIACIKCPRFVQYHVCLHILLLFVLGEFCKLFGSVHSQRRRLVSIICVLCPRLQDQLLTLYSDVLT